MYCWDFIEVRICCNCSFVGLGIIIKQNGSYLYTGSGWEVVVWRVVTFGAYFMDSSSSFM